MVGKQISHYEILEKLGAGGMGVVYKAKDLKLDRIVALKFLPSSLDSDKSLKDRFIQEAKAASALDHPNIGTIYEIEETDDGQMFIAMAYYAGETLKKKLSSGALPIEEVMDLAIQVAQGLTRVHSEGIVHRDIKPANIMLSREGLPKIVDFGLAKLMDISKVTATGATLGTPGYMSPEQARAEPVDHRTDLWSLGALLYEMVTGKTPFAAGHPQAVLHAILNDRPRSLRTLRPETPPELERIVCKALEKDPRKRYQGAVEMLGDLEAVQADTDLGVTRLRPAPSGTQRKRKWMVIAVATSLLLIVAGLYYWQVQKTWEAEALMASMRPAIKEGRMNEVFEQLRASGIELNDSRFDSLVPSIAGRLTIDTVPSGASVSVVRVPSVEDFSEDQTLEIGETPISLFRLVAGEYLVRIARNGFSRAELLVQLEPGQTLQVLHSLPEASPETQGMVGVNEGSSLVLAEGEVVPAFLIDRNEITNEQFLEFVASGGYREPAFWPDSLLVDGKPTLWSEAVKAFVDRAGISGPRGWSGGTFPEGRGDHPVVGVSWYEASAYARWANKELPTWDQWWRAALGEKGEVFPWGVDVMTVEARSNFGQEGTGPVGTNILGISPFGCYDMAGSVREWLLGEVDGERRVVGGSWLDPSYMFEPSHAEFFEPSYANEAIGFRCVRRWK